MAPDGTWNEWSKWVIKTLEDLTKKVDKLNEEVITLKVKAGIWGLLGGLIPVLITILLYFISNMKK